MLTNEALRVLEIVGSYRQPDQTPVENRAMWERIGAEVIAPQVPEGTRVDAVDIGEMAAEWVSASDAASDRVVLYLHGGAYAVCSPRTHRALAAGLSQASLARVLVLDYRRAPEHPFPAAAEDAHAGYRWLLNEGFDPAKLAVAGDSAGGGLMLATLISARDAGEPVPAAGVGISTWSDIECSGQTMVTNAPTDPWISREGLGGSGRVYLNGADPHHPLASPMYADLRGLPPLFLVVSAHETLLDDTLRLAERARAAGVDVAVEQWPGMIHDWPLFPDLIPEGRQTLDQIGGWLNTRLE